MEASASIVDRREEGWKTRTYLEVDCGDSKIRARHDRTTICGSAYNEALRRNRLTVG